MLSVLAIQGRNVMKSSSIQNPTIKLRTLLSIVFLISSLLLSSCSSIISVSRDKPIGENYGKRTPGAYVDDQLIETKSKVNLKKIDARFANAQVRIDSFNGVVLLTGNVPAADMRTTATETIRKIRKVRRVNNELQVSPPRSFGAKAGDVWLSNKVKTRLRFTKKAPHSRVNVVTENGVIYLMGLVTRKEAETIVNVAKKSYGLQKIVRVFEYID
ncbi:MAG: BON domain-containing protein [Pseudomonadales bacterium]|nr:BON domain-containing protein [Pseudomonadales bacterium]